MLNLPVIIYCTSDGPRLRYIAGIILGDILGLKWNVVTDRRRLGKNPVINYSRENIRNSFKIIPSSILFEKEIKKQEINVRKLNGPPFFFPSEEGSDFHFDIFAASFFLVTRYEEYLEFVPDEQGRFRASSSAAFENSFLQEPVVDLWVREFAKALLRKFQALTFRRNEYRAMLTIDADQPLESRGMNLPDLLGELLDFKKKQSNIPHNPAHEDVFEYIIRNIEANNSDSKFFFPVGNTTRPDRNPSWKNDSYRNLIRKISAAYETGLHPSVNGASRYSVLTEEISRLKKILAGEVSSNRFHRVKFVIPDSYRYLIKAGITLEYSMGYPDEPGFRAGIARPFYFYDVLSDSQTELKIIPFQFHDNIFNNIKDGQITDLILKLINETRKVRGLFASCWHNSSLSSAAEMKERRQVFEFMLKSQAP